MPAPSSVPSPSLLAASVIMQANGLSNQVGSQITRLQGIIANGANGVSAADLATALGPNLAIIQAQLTALQAALPSA